VEVKNSFCMSDLIAVGSGFSYHSASALGKAVTRFSQALIVSVFFLSFTAAAKIYDGVR
jgi:hypothetical protein